MKDATARETSYLLDDNNNLNEDFAPNGCFHRITSALYSFFRSPYTIFASLVGTSVAASAASVTNFSQELEHLEEGAHEAGINFPVHSNTIIYTALTIEMACVGTYIIYRKLKSALTDCELPTEKCKMLGSALAGTAIAVAPYISYELFPPQYKLPISIPLSFISTTMGGITLYNYVKESHEFSPLLLARAIAGATIFCGILFKIEMKDAEHEGMDTYKELFTSRFGAWLMATTGNYFLSKLIISYNHYIHEHDSHTESNSLITRAGIYSSDAIAFVAREIALGAVISQILKEAELSQKASLALALSSALIFNALMAVDDHKELTKLIHKIPTSISDLSEIYSSCSIKNCLKGLFSTTHGTLESVPLVGVSLGVMNEWKTGEGYGLDITLRSILAGNFAFVRINSEAQEILELLSNHDDAHPHSEHVEMSLNGATEEYSEI